MARREIDAWYWQIEDSLNRLSEAMSQSIPAVAPRRCWQPRIDLYEESKRFVVKAELAGVRHEDVQVGYLPDRHSIFIRGVRIEDEEGARERTNIYQLEIFYGEFEREIRLPEAPIEPENISTSWRTGILRVSIPKASVRINRTRITIRRV